ncbi:hypothetical protein MMC11_004438 [Xylographa trunciseda]|nr:hypothetical protein [Xylographa trunciseda]
MTSVDAAAVAAEVAASLTMEEVPMKLRCSVCSLLAVGAVRMPCCEQNLCENCEANLDNECPVCLHSTVDKTLIKPNKTLRTTIKAFLKKKVMEKETQRKKDEASKLVNMTVTASTVPEIIAAPVADLTEQRSLKAEDLVNGNIRTEGTIDAPEAPPEQDIAEAQMDIPRPSIETTNDNVGTSTQPEKGDSVDGSKGDERRDSGVSNPMAESAEAQSMSMQWPVNGATGLAMPNGAPNMNGMNGVLPLDFSQMMQYMPNGMPTNMMGAFPNMMGMPGMGMDPMAMTQAMSQSMYGGFGGPNMGMNGMNGMNMGMGFNAGQGAFGGFNGQLDSWNTGQDNYNANAYGANGMGGNFGTHAGHGGYNMSSHQGNYNQMNHHQYPNNDFHHGHNNHGFQTRGRGRRGHQNAGRGQGGYNAMNQGNQNGNANYEPFHHQLPPQASYQNSTQQPEREPLPAVHLENRDSPEVKEGQASDAVDIQKANEEQMNKELNPGGENEEPEIEIPLTEHEVIADETATEQNATEIPSSATDEPSREAKIEEEPENSKPMPIQTFISSDDARMGKLQLQDSLKTTSMPPPAGPAIPQGPSAKHSQEASQDQSGWGRGAGRGFYRGAANGRGEYRARGAAYMPNGNAIHSSPTSISPSGNFPPVAPIIPKGLGVEGAPTGPKALREGLPNTGIRGGRGFSIVGRAHTSTHARTDERIRSRSPSNSRHRSRSRSAETSQHKSDRRRTHRHRSKSLSEIDEHERRKERRHRRSRKYDDEEAEGDQESRHREASVESASKKSSHRNHRHHYKEESRSSSHRHHRDRSRDRDRDEERRHRKKRSRSPVSVVPTPTSAVTLDFPSTQDKEESRKRRDRDRDDGDQLEHNRHRSRKRSRRERSATPNGDNPSVHRKIRDHESSRNQEDEREVREPKSLSDSRRPSIVSPSTEKAGPTAPKSIPTGPKVPEKDHHTLEREARNRERLLKEMQRRAATEGTAPKRKGSGLEARVQRKPSYKYEDEENEEARTIRVEREREGARWN